MPYIGREPTNSGQFLLIDDISSNFNGSNTSFDLKIGGNAINPAKENVIVALDGILQQADDAYTVSGSKITLTEAPGSGVSFYGVLAGASQFIESDSITNDKISPTANISGSKINTSFAAQTVTAKDFGGNVSGSSTSTGSFGNVNVAELSIPSVKTLSSSIATGIAGNTSNRTSLSSSAAADIASNLVSITNNSSSAAADIAANLVSITNNSSSAAADIASNLSTINTLKGSGTTQGVGQGNSPTFAAGTITGNFNVGGTLTAQEVHTEFESASILFTSGSTIFGNSSDDVHNMTGSLNISGSLFVKDGTLTVTDNVDFNGDLDVDGTSNLDVVDIDGAVTQDGGHFIINEAGGDYDFRVESDGNTHAFVMDGQQGFIGMGASAPGYVNGNDHRGGNTQTTSGAGGLLHLQGLVPRIILDDNGDTPQFAIEAQDYFSILELADDSTTETTRLRIAKDTGNVGIGTVSPDQKLHLYSTSANSPNILIQNENDSAAEGGAAGGIEFYLKDDNGSNPDFQDLGIIRWTGHDKDNPYNKFTAAAITGSADDPGNSSGRIDLNVAYSDTMIDAMTIRAAAAGKSRVGIGSTAPAGTIDVFGDDGYAYFTTTSPAAFNMIFRSGSADPQNNWLGQIEFTGATSANSQIVTRNSTTLALGSNNVQTLFITDDDRVGIGTDNPNSLLTVFGDNKHIEVRSADYSLALMGAAGSSGAGLDRGIIQLYEDGNTNVELLGEGSLMLDDRGDNVSSLLIKSTGNIDHGMSNYDDGDVWHKVSRASNEGGVQFVGYSERKIGIEMICRYNGDENSSYDSSGQSTSTQAPINIVCQRASGVSVGAVPADKNMLSIRNLTTTRFIFNSNGTAYAGDSWTTISDKRVKKDIKDIPYGLDEVNKLEPKIFTRYDADFDDEGNVVLEGDGKKQIGFIAQEIKEVVPEMIANQNQDLTEGFYVMDDGKLTSVLVKAVQELSAEIENIKKTCKCMKEE